MKYIHRSLQVTICLLMAFQTGHAGPTSITSDGTLGTTVTPTGSVYDIDGGTISGTNQFHSFGDFSVGAGDTASFNGPSGTKNIISRVTGGAISDIDGTVGSTIIGANLYLLNPAGVLIGPNAQLSVDGSVHFSTADFLRFSDAEIFLATKEGSTFSAAAPSAFGFLDASNATIVVNTASFDIFQVAAGETLSFVGGDLTMGTADGLTPAFILAPGGNVNLVSVASTGEAVIEANGSISTDSFSQLGDARLQGGSIIDSKNIYVRAGSFVIDEAAIFPGAFSFFGLSPSPDGGIIDINVTNEFTITGTGLVLPDLLDQRPGLVAFAGDFVVGTAPAAKVPDISIETGSLIISNTGIIEVARVGDGDAGAITIDASNSVELLNGGTISALNAFEGLGTSITINAQDVTLDGSGSSDLTRITASSVLHPDYLVGSIDPALTTATGGTITINATNNLIVNNAQIASEGQSYGGSSDITLSAANATFDSQGTVIDENGGTSGLTRTIVSTQSSFAGDSGNITLDVDGKLDITNGAVISVNTLGSGDGGNLTVNASEVNIAGTASGLASQSVPLVGEQADAYAQLVIGGDFDVLLVELGLPPDADILDALIVLNDFGLTDGITDFIAGDGGTIAVTTSNLTVSGQDAAIDSSTAWDGNGGSVLLNADNIAVSDGATIGSRSGIARIDTGEIFVGTGNGGNIMINTSNSVSLQNDGSISASSLGAGQAGKISVSSTDISLDSSSITSQAEGTGAGGEITLTASNSATLGNGASISASSLGTGDAGNISIDAGDTLDITDSNISTQAKDSEGGDIKLVAVSMIYLDQSEITTSVKSSAGGGGDINIDPDFVILKQSKISANAFKGHGGNINIVAGNFIATPDSIVEASSEKGIDGTVNISSPDETVSDDLVVLPDNYLDVTSLIGDRCGTSPGSSSLVDAGPGGRTIDPDGYLPSFVATENSNNKEINGDKSVSSGKRWWAPYAHKQELQLAQVTCTY